MPRMLTSNCVFISIPHVVTRVEDDLEAESFKLLPSIPVSHQLDTIWPLVYFADVKIEEDCR